MERVPRAIVSQGEVAQPADIVLGRCGRGRETVAW